MKIGRKKRENKLRSLIYANKHFTPYHISDQKNTISKKREFYLQQAVHTFQFQIPQILTLFGFSPSVMGGSVLKDICRGHNWLVKSKIGETISTCFKGFSFINPNPIVQCGIIKIIEDMIQRIQSLAQFHKLGPQNRVLSFNVEVMMGDEIDAC